MAITVNNANLLFKDPSGNVGKVKNFTDSDITKISNAISTVGTHTTQIADLSSKVSTNTTNIAGNTSAISALSTRVGKIVDSSGNLTKATTSAYGTVILASASDITAGTAGKVVTADQLSSITPAGNFVTLDTEQTVTAKKTFSSGIDTASVSSGSGASITLTDETASVDAGKFDITATNGSKTSTLEGTADGKLTWNGKPFITEINGQSASSSGSIHIDVSHLGHESTIGVMGEQGFGVGFCDATQSELDQINSTHVDLI